MGSSDYDEVNEEIWEEIVRLGGPFKELREAPATDR